MISIISIADGVLRDRAKSLKLVGTNIHVVGSHRVYSTVHYAMVDADSSAFEPGKARLTDEGTWEAYSVVRILILAQLAKIDARKIRALSDAVLTGDKSKLAILEAAAVALREQLR